MTPRRLLPLLLTAALLVLAGCSVVGSVESLLGFGPPRTALRTLTVTADPGANQGSATQLDVVWVFDESLSARLPKSGPDWFRQRAALQASLATGIAVVSLEVPAASPQFTVEPPARAREAAAVVVFANYVTEAGWPAITLTPFRSVALRLMPDTVSVAGK